MTFKEGHIAWNIGNHLSLETRQKMSEAHRGHLASEETRMKIADACKGKHHSEQTRRRISDSNKGKVSWKKGLTKETDERVGHGWSKGLNKETDQRIKALSDSLKGRVAWNKGKHPSEETRKRMSESAKGKIHGFKKGQISPNKGKHPTPDTIEKLRKSHLGKPSSMKNKHHTAEAKEKIRQANLGKVPWNKDLKKETDLRVKVYSEKLQGSRKGFTPWSKGKHLSPETKKKLSDANKGRLGTWIGHKHSTKSKQKMSISAHGKHTGTKNPFYIDGRSKMSRQYRGEDWRTIRRLALERDKYKCGSSNTDECKGRLVVHHLDPYFISHNNNLDNLITLCHHHHHIIETNNLNELKDRRM